MSDLYIRIEEAERELGAVEKRLTEAKAQLNELYRERKRQRPLIVCEDNLLPEGPRCPSCGLERAVSAVTEGWVHHPIHVLSRKDLLNALASGDTEATNRILNLM